jgi:hypothetical protein
MPTHAFAVEGAKKRQSVSIFLINQTGFLVGRMIFRPSTTTLEQMMKPLGVPIFVRHPLILSPTAPLVYNTLILMQKWIMKWLLDSINSPRGLTIVFNVFQ